MTMGATTERQVAVLIDYENVGLKSIQWLFDQLSDVGRIIVKRAYADWSAAASQREHRQQRDRLLELGIEPIHLFISGSGKNSSDIRLVIDAVELLYLSTVDTFVIVSSDTDFVPLVSKLRAAGKTVFGAGRTAAVSQTLVRSCDRYYDLDQSERSRAETPTTSEPVVESLLVRAVKVGMDEGGRIAGSKLHETLQRLDPSFDFRVLGFSTFTRYLEASKEVSVARPTRGQSDMTVELTEVAERVTTAPAIEPADPETVGPKIDAAWLNRASMPGQSFSGTTAANDAAKVLGVQKLSDSPHKRLQGLLDAISYLSARWLRRENRIVRR
jgi:uncharacterized protein (TIGR00288 family)